MRPTPGSLPRTPDSAAADLDAALFQPTGWFCLNNGNQRVVRADGGSALLIEAPVAPSRTAARLAGRFGPAQLTGIETALLQVYTRWLAGGPSTGPGSAGAA